MICKIHNIECCFMSKKGCIANGGDCYTIIDKCTGCNRIVEYKPERGYSNHYCSTCPDPKVSWRRGNCVFATHIVEELTKDGKVLNAMKASKRKARGK